MATVPVTKIYELRTIGYDQVKAQLDKVEESFRKIKDLKQALNKEKVTTEDAARIAEINEQLIQEKIKTQELRLERQKLVNESKAIQNAKQAEINQSKQLASALQAEAGSYADVTNKIKELKSLVKPISANSGTLINFDGSTYTYQQAINKLKELMLTEQAWRRQFQADAVLTGEYTRGIVQAFNQLGLGDLVQGQLTKLIARARELDVEFEKLKQDIAAVPKGSAEFSQLEQKLIANRTEALNLDKQIIQLRSDMRGMGDIGNQISSGIAAGFERLKGSLSSLILTYAGWFAAFREIGGLITENVKLSDSFADLQIRIHGTKEDVENLFESLKKIDTRTSLKDLVDIANTVAKKGVPKEEIADLTKEFDKLNVVLGKEIGEPQTATANIIKLITIFNDDKRVTAQRVNEIATSLFKLTTSGVATGEFLVNFAERVGAVRGITGLTLPNILGLGAALQQLGQRTEVAGTAAVQLTTKLFTNVEKFAKAAQLSVEDFRKLLKDNPFQALIAVAEGLKSLGGDELHQNFEEIVQAFGEVGIVGVRIKAVLGDIATNGKFVAERMKQAAVGTQDYASQSAAAELKQNTLAATIAKVRKEFELLGTNKAVQVTLAAIAAVVLALVNNLGLIITVLAAYGAAWTVANAEMIAARISTIATNIAFTAQYAILQISTIWTRAYTAALGLFTAETNAATAATRLLGLSIKLLGIGALITLVAAMFGAFQTAKAGITGTTEELRKLARQRQINQEIDEKANEIIGDQISKLEALVKIVTSSNTSYDTSRIALDKLIESNSKFSSALQGTTINLNEVKRAMESVRNEIILNARAQASAALTAEKYQKYLSVVTTRQAFETETALGKTPEDIFKSLPKSQTDVIFKAETRPGVLFSPYGNKQIIESLKKAEQETLTTYQEYLDVSSNIEKQVIDKTNETNKKTVEHLSEINDEKIKRGLVNKLSKEELEDVIKTINEEINKLKEGDPKLTQLLNLRQQFQERLDKINKPFKKTPEYRGARLSGDVRDDFSEIDAQMKKEIEDEETRFVKLQLDHRATFGEEEEYLRNLTDIQIKYIDQKVKRLESEKNLNAKEKEVLASFNKEKVDLQLKLIKDIQSLHDKEFQDRRNQLKEQLDQQVADLQLQTEVAQKNPQLSQTDKAQIKLDNDKKILDLQIKYNEDIDKLEKELNQRSRENAKEGAAAILKIKKDLVDDARQVAAAEIVDIRNSADKQISEYKINYSKLRQAILDNDKLTADQKRKQIERLSKLENFTIASAELARLTLEFKKIKEQYDKGLVDEKTYLEAKQKLEDAAEKQKQAKKELKSADVQLPSGQTTQNVIVDNLSTSFGFEDNSPEKKLLGEVISQAYDTAKLAMNSFFDAQKARVQEELSLTLQRLDIEKEQVKARAQTEQEKESIDKQYAAKKAKAEREAGEKLKSIKRSEAKIALATELANIAVAAASNPANGVTFGAAGAIMYALLAGLAVARYAINIKNINSEKFEKGGNPDLSTIRGGIVKGRSHSNGGNPFIFKGRVFEDEVDELNIIRTRSVNKDIVHTIKGTHTQIASKLNSLGGGVNFAPGAVTVPSGKTFAEGGIVGNYSAPVYVPSNIQNSEQNNLEFFAKITEMTLAINDRIDRLEVYQTTDSVTKAQAKIVKQNEIGTIL